MPPPETTARYEKVVLLRFGNAYDDFGVALLYDPIEIDVRWQKVTRSMQDASGNPIAIEAELVVNQVIAIGSGIWRGRLADWPGSSVTDLMYVKVYNEIPDIKGRRIRRTISLMRWSDGLPSFVSGSGTG